MTNRDLIVSGVIVFMSGVVVGVFGYWYTVNNGNNISLPYINSFEECIVAGYPIMESYPEQCKTPDGKTFVRILDNEENKKACTMEAKLCPDGSYVSRTGPNCEFASCSQKIEPEPKPVSFGVCKTDADCSEGYYCTDISPVVREGYQNLRCWKKGMPTPICLSGNTMIATPSGEVAIKNLSLGMSVWTLDEKNKKIAAKIIAAAKTPAPDNHRVMHIVLANGKELLISPGHALADGRLAADIKSGELVENMKVLKAELTLYNENFTYDILPDSATGVYWGNDILLQSTLNR